MTVCRRKWRAEEDGFSANGVWEGEYSRVLFGQCGDFRSRLVVVARSFSRWGELVFERVDFPPNDLHYGWNGTFRGKDLPAGVFAWSVEVEFLDGAVVAVEGDVAVVR